MAELSQDELLDLLKTEIITECDGTITYRLNGALHRVHGPALIYGDYAEYWLNGKLHRLSAPAVTDPSGHYPTEWWLYGKKYTKEQYNRKVLTFSEIPV